MNDYVYHTLAALYRSSPTAQLILNDIGTMPLRAGDTEQLQNMLTLCIDTVSRGLDQETIIVKDEQTYNILTGLLCIALNIVTNNEFLKKDNTSRH